MAKRLTDTDKWKKTFVKSLPAEYKIFWMYLLDDCDIAGIWQVDFEVAELRLGIKLSEEKALRFYKDKVVVFDNGTKWFVQDFISFQYGNLTEKNKMFNPVMSILNKYKEEIEKSNMGHLSSIYGGKDKDKDKVKDTNGGMGGEIPIPEPLNLQQSVKPTFDDVHAFFVGSGKSKEEAQKFFNYYDGLGWRKGNSPIFNWRSFASNWMADPKQKEDGNASAFEDEWQKLKERR